MTVKWTKKDVQVTTAMQDRVSTKLDKLKEKYKDDTLHLTISLTQHKKKPAINKNASYRVKGVLTTPNGTITSEAKEMDYYDAVDKLMSVIERNYKKEKAKHEKVNREMKRELKESMYPALDEDEFGDMEFEGAV